MDLAPPMILSDIGRVTPSPTAPRRSDARDQTSFALPSSDAFEVMRRGVWIIALKELADADLADEVAQETISRLLDALEKQGAAIVDPAAFARGIARHVIADLRARRKRLDPLERVENSVVHASAADPLARAVSEEQLARLRQCLATLAPTDRELLRVLFVNDITPGDLAARTGEPAERIRKRKSRALDRLRQAFLGHDLPSAATADGEDT